MLDLVRVSGTDQPCPHDRAEDIVLALKPESHRLRCRVVGPWTRELLDRLEIPFVQVQTDRVVVVRTESDLECTRKCDLELRELEDVVWQSQPHVIRSHGCVEFEFTVTNLERQ